MMTRKHFEWVADSVAPLVGSPIIIERMADELEAMNPRFNKEKFLRRAIEAWEKSHDITIDDEIPY